MAQCAMDESESTEPEPRQGVGGGEKRKSRENDFCVMDTFKTGPPMEPMYKVLCVLSVSSHPCWVLDFN